MTAYGQPWLSDVSLLLHPDARCCVETTSAFGESAHRCRKTADLQVGNLRLWVCRFHGDRLVGQVRELEAEAREATAQEAISQERRLSLAAQERRDAASCVYMVGRDGFVKIGTTAHLKRRLARLGRGDPAVIAHGITPGPVEFLAALRGGRTIERQLHGQFARCHVAGEWFLPDLEMRLFIHRLRERAEITP